MYLENSNLMPKYMTWVMPEWWEICVCVSRPPPQLLLFPQSLFHIILYQVLLLIQKKRMLIAQTEEKKMWKISRSNALGP